MLVMLCGLTACSHLHWPFHRRPPPPPVPVHELTEKPLPGASAAEFPQYWKRNTLVLDLQSVTGNGGVLLEPRSGAGWPVRLALRVMPGSVGQLEVRGDQRLILPVTASGTKPIDLELAPGIYTSATAQISVSWGPQS